MDKHNTELVFILDRSGSMYGLESDTIGGFNAMLNKQKALDGPCRITTVLFDNQYQLLHDRIDLQAVSPISEKDYTVGGSTALLDAMGQTIQKISAVQQSTAPEFQADKVLFVVITDGAENASREYSADKVKAMVQHQTKQHGWEFLFLGANIDAVETASHFGIASHGAATYVPDSAGTTLNFQAISNALSYCRTVGTLSNEALDAIRKDMKTRGTP